MFIHVFRDFYFLFTTTENIPITTLYIATYYLDTLPTVNQLTTFYLCHPKTHSYTLCNRPGEESTRRLQFYKELFATFQLGDCYFLIFNYVNHIIGYMHPSVSEIMDYSPALKNSQIMDIFDRIHPEDKVYFVRYDYRLHKANCNHTAELLHTAFREGWL